MKSETKEIKEEIENLLLQVESDNLNSKEIVKIQEVQIAELRESLSEVSDRLKKLLTRDAEEILDVISE